MNYRRNSKQNSERNLKHAVVRTSGATSGGILSEISGVIFWTNFQKFANSESFGEIPPMHERVLEGTFAVILAGDSPRNTCGNFQWIFRSIFE